MALPEQKPHFVLNSDYAEGDIKDWWITRIIDKRIREIGRGIHSRSDWQMQVANSRKELEVLCNETIHEMGAQYIVIHSNILMQALTYYGEINDKIKYNWASEDKAKVEAHVLLYRNFFSF